jgi:hypothetical protein
MVLLRFGRFLSVPPRSQIKIYVESQEQEARETAKEEARGQASANPGEVDGQHWTYVIKP